MNKNIIQQGRSMIEMLGVLAIIGMLSIGGMIGYSKAMERYRVNETINQITYVVQNTRDLFKTQRDFYGAIADSTSRAHMSGANYANRKLADKTKIFPDSLVKNNYKNMFGGEIRFYSDGRFAENDSKAFVLGFWSIPQEACIELVTRDWQSSLGLVAMRVALINNGYFGIEGYYNGHCTTQYTEGVGIFCAKDMPITLEQATTVCNDEKENNIWWKFY